MRYLVISVICGKVSWWQELVRNSLQRLEANTNSSHNVIQLKYKTFDSALHINLIFQFAESEQSDIFCSNYVAQFIYLFSIKSFLFKYQFIITVHRGYSFLSFLFNKKKIVKSNEKWKLWNWRIYWHEKSFCRNNKRYGKINFS